MGTIKKIMSLFIFAFVSCGVYPLLDELEKNVYPLEDGFNHSYVVTTDYDQDGPDTDVFNNTIICPYYKLLVQMNGEPDSDIEPIKMDKDLKIQSVKNTFLADCIENYIGEDIKQKYYYEEQIIKLVKNDKANINCRATTSKAELYRLPLERAIAQLDPECIELLLKLGADIRKRNVEYYWSMLLNKKIWLNIRNEHEALKSNIRECIKLLVKAGLPVNIEMQNLYSPSRIETPLIMAIDCRDYWAIKFLCDNGVEVKKKYQGRTVRDIVIFSYNQCIKQYNLMRLYATNESLRNLEGWMQYLSKVRRILEQCENKPKKDV